MKLPMQKKSIKEVEVAIIKIMVDQIKIIIAKT